MSSSEELKLEISEEIPENERKILESMASNLSQLEYLWSKYFEVAKRIIEEWDTSRSIVLRRIVELEHLINHLESRIKELEVRHEIGLIDDEIFEKIINDYKNRIDKYREMLSSLKISFDSINAAINNHKKRVMPYTLRVEKEELREKLANLERMWHEGKVRREVYERLKRELEILLEQLE